MTTSELYTQSFSAYKIKPEHPINDLMNELGYLYMHY